MVNSITRIKKYKFSKQGFLNLPKKPGIYIYFNENNIPIYIGKSVNLYERVKSYKLDMLSEKTKQMVSNIKNFSFIEVLSEIESLILEANLIKLYRPKFNISLKDDKNYLYIRITSDEFPRILTARKIDLSQKNAAYFGPYPQAKSVKFLLRFLRRIFPYSQHKLQNKACFYSQIGLCNPCPNEISKIKDEKIKSQLKKTYLENIKSIRRILSGRSQTITSVLTKLMKRYSKEDNFEVSNKIKYVLENIDYISQKITPSSYYLKNPNLAQDIYSEQLKSLYKLLSKLNIIEKDLIRIEGFDIAHIQGNFVTASMVTFIDGVENKNLYRRFRVRQTRGSDDYSSLQEIAIRRLKHLKDWGKPDLILIDGGKGQVAEFLKVFKDNNIPIIGLAKRNETLIIPINLDPIKYLEYKMPDIPAKKMLQRIRNESHRFARLYHHLLFNKNLIPQLK